MDALQNLFYGFGHIAYAVAMADGIVQREEHEKVHDLVKEGMQTVAVDFDYSDIIFQVLEKEHLDAETTYKWGIDAITMSSYKLNEELIEMFTNTLAKIAEAFPPTEKVEQNYIEQFAQDIKRLK